MITRRNFCIVLGGLVACNGSKQTSPVEPQRDKAAPKGKEGDMERNEDPGFNVQSGPSWLVFQRDRVIDATKDPAVVLDATTLAEIEKLPVGGALTVLPDDSIAVLVRTDKGTDLHHVVKNKVVAKFSSSPGELFASDKPNELWRLVGGLAMREKFGDGKLAHMMVPIKAIDVVDPSNGRRPGVVAALADGNFAFVGNSEIYKVELSGPKMFAREGNTIRHIGPGPDPMSLWVSNGYDKLELVKLAGDKAQVQKSYVIEPDTIIHMAGAGKHAAVVIAHGHGPGVTYSVAVFDETKERWRQPLGGERLAYYVALNDKRVIVRAGDKLRGFDLATGK